MLVRKRAHEQLRDWVARSGRTYPEVATTLAISRSYLSRLVTGNRLPSLDLADRIHALTGIPMAEWAIDERVSA